MASGPDLFVVCKNCGSEVSPYITECPYCGTRLRKRAPKLERGGIPKAPKRRAQARGPRSGGCKPGEIPGIRADRRPYATIVLVLAAIFVLAARCRRASCAARPRARRPTPPTSTSATVTTLFVYNATATRSSRSARSSCSAGCSSAATAAWAPLLVFLAGGAGGMLLAIAGDDVGCRHGGNGAALALLARGRCATCSAAAAAGGRRRPARRARDRGRADPAPAGHRRGERARRARRRDRRGGARRDPRAAAPSLDDRGDWLL